MQHAICFDDDLHCLIISTTGPATVRDILAMVDEAIRDSRRRRGTNVIVDYRRSELDALSGGETHALASVIKKLKEEIGGGRIAHVVSRTVDYGMIRMWENLIADEVLFEFQVFFSIDDARKWVAR